MDNECVDVSVEMTAHRPNTSPFDYMEYTISENDEESPGAGIRVNGDDNNDNLIRVKLEVNSTPVPEGFEYVLKRSNDNIKVWDTSSKTGPILDGNDEQVLNFSTSPEIVWVENPSGGSAFLELQLRETGETTAISYDKIKFYPFTSVVIVMGGEDQSPTDPPQAGEGTFVIGRNLYLDGYDVHMFDEDELYGNVQNEAENAVKERDVGEIAIFGYSHGGGGTYILANYLNNNRATIGTFTISFTAYTDAVQDSFPYFPPEDRRPPSTNYLINYYETNDFPRGSHIQDLQYILIPDSLFSYILKIQHLTDNVDKTGCLIFPKSKNNEDPNQALHLIDFLDQI